LPLSYRRYVKSGLEIPENPLADALRGWVLGSEAFLKRMVVLAETEHDQRRQRTSRRLKATTPDEIILATAAYHGLGPEEYVEFRSQAAGREQAAFLCHRWTGEPLSRLSARFGLSHPDSSSNLIRRATKRMADSKSYRDSINDIEWNPGLKTENPT
jgi:putative transposase